MQYVGFETVVSHVNLYSYIYSVVGGGVQSLDLKTKYLLNGIPALTCSHIYIQQ